MEEPQEHTGLARDSWPWAIGRNVPCHCNGVSCPIGSSNHDWRPSIKSLVSLGMLIPRPASLEGPVSELSGGHDFLKLDR